MRPYRWQDPAPAPVAAIRERRTKRVPINCAQTAPEQPSMVLDGVEYVEAPELTCTSGRWGFSNTPKP